MDQHSSGLPLISVLTPVYNGEAYLQQSIESVLAQTYTNWDYTIVNNRSKDRSLEIARWYGARDPRIRVVDNERFLPVIANHNHTFRQASPHSKYCKMVFADDWLFPECLEKMVQVAEQHPSVGIVGAYGIRGTKLAWTGLPYPTQVFSGREVCRRKFLEGLYVFGTATSQLFRTELVLGRNPFYNEENLHADTEICFDLLRRCDFGFVHQVLTFTRVDENSLDAFARDFQTTLPSALLDLIHFGPAYLTREEIAACRKRLLRKYYEILSVAFLRRREPKFWEYHRAKLQEAGKPLSRVRLAEAVLRKAAWSLAAPRKLVRRWRTARPPEEPLPAPVFGSLDAKIPHGCDS